MNPKGRPSQPDPHETSAVLISPPQSCRSDSHTGTEGETAVAAPVSEQRRVRAEAKTEDSEELPPDKHQRKDSDAAPVAQWRAHTAGDEVQGTYRQHAATPECLTLSRTTESCSGCHCADWPRCGLVPTRMRWRGG